AALAVPGSADARFGGYDGTWTTVFATTRGNCSSGLSVPFLVYGGRVSSAGGGRVSGSVSRSGRVAVAGFGRGSPAPPWRPHPRGGGRLAGNPGARGWIGITQGTRGAAPCRATRG